MAEHGQAVITAEPRPGRGVVVVDDVASVDEFLGRNRVVAWRVARTRTRNDADADDALAGGVERFWRSVQRGALEEHPDPLGYLLRCVRSAAIDNGRRSTKQAALHSTDRSDDPPSPEALAMTDDPAEVIDLLDHLPPRQRDAIQLVDGQGLTSDEVGERLGMDPNAVRQLVFRARRNARLRWATRTAGPAVGSDCDGVTLQLFKPVVADEAAEHLRACDRCETLRLEIATRGRLGRALILLPWPSTALGRRLRSRGRTAAAGAVAAAVAATGIAGASLLGDGSPPSSASTADAAALESPASSEPTPLPPAPVEDLPAPVDVPSTALPTPSRSAGTHDDPSGQPDRARAMGPETAPTEPIELPVAAAPTTDLPPTDLPTTEAPVPQPPGTEAVAEPLPDQTLEIALEVAPIRLEVGLGPPSDDPLVIDLSP